MVARRIAHRLRGEPAPGSGPAATARTCSRVDVESRDVTAVTAWTAVVFGLPTWLPDGRSLAALGHRLPANAGSRNDIWVFAADGSDATPDGGRNLSADHDLMPGSAMNSDVTIGDLDRLIPSADGSWLTFSAPIQGSYELFRIAVADGSLERITNGAHYISGWDGVAGEAIDGRLPGRLPPLDADRTP